MQVYRKRDKKNDAKVTCDISHIRKGISEKQEDRKNE